MLPTTRPARESDLPRLREIERLAGQLFAEIDMTLVAEDEPASVEELRTYVAAGRAFVAEVRECSGVPAGYLLLDEVDGLAHLEQVSVDPAFGGQGLGSLLVGRAIAWAREHHYRAITLTTFTSVAWNGPWYGRLGFRVVESPAPGLRSIRDRWSLRSRRRRRGPGQCPGSGRSGSALRR